MLYICVQHFMVHQTYSPIQDIICYTGTPFHCLVFINTQPMPKSKRVTHSLTVWTLGVAMSSILNMRMEKILWLQKE